MRAFIGISVPEVAHYDRLCSDLKNRYGNNVKIVGNHNLHITLKFLGDIPLDRCEEIWHSLVLPDNSFHISGKGIGHFPVDNERARVIFIPVSSPGLDMIMENNELFNENVQHIHCTLARFRRPSNIGDMEKIYSSEKFFDFLPNKLSLFKSILLSTGPVYEEIFSHQLM